MYVGGANNEKWKIEKCIFYQVHFSGSSTLENLRFYRLRFSAIFIRNLVFGPHLVTEGGGRLSL